MIGEALSPERLGKELRRALVIAGKDVRIYCLKPPVLLFGLVFPFFLFLAFFVGKKGPISEGIPGLIAISIFFAASNIAPAGLPYERMFRTFSRYLSAPISLDWMIFGKTLAGFIFGVLVSVIPLLVGVIGYGISVTSPVLLVLALLAGGMCFSCMGTLVGSMPTDAPGNVMTVLNFVRLPLLFMSGIFVPLADMPGWARGLAAVSPLTYANDLLRHSMDLDGYYPWWLGLLVLVLYSVVFFTIAAWIFNVSRRRS
ncbi:MAG: ABC transporter permease [Actinomycetota bacterium]|nr:ABC transporter permease [Actinomycetota bacterium]MDD5668162.1 ABC transporter permease [Actinomycetota bacterium]